MLRFVYPRPCASARLSRDPNVSTLKRADFLQGRLKMMVSPMLRWRMSRRSLPLLTGLLLLASCAAQAQSDAGLEAIKNRAFEFYAAGRYTEAVPVAEQYANAVVTRFGEDHPLYANALGYIGHLHWRLGQYDAVRSVERALRIQEKHLPQDHPDIARNLTILALFYLASGRYAEAEPLYNRALNISEKAFGPEHADVATALNELGTLYRRQGRHTEAEPLYRRALAIRERTLGQGHPDVGISLNGLGEIKRKQGRYGEAESLYEQSLTIAENALGPDHPDVGFRLNNLALVYGATRRHAEAESLYKRALAIFDKALGAGHPEVANSLNNLAGLYLNNNRLMDAEPLMTRALEIRETTLPANHPVVAESLTNLSRLYYARREWGIATDYARRATTIIVERAKRTLRADDLMAAGASADDFSRNSLPFVRFLLAAWQLAEQKPHLRAALSEEVFIAGQRWGQTSAGAALAQMSSRFSIGDSDLSQLVREQENLIRIWQQLGRQIVAARAMPPERRDLRAEAGLADRFAAADGRLVSLNLRLAKDFPEYAALANPEPLSFKATQDQLRPDEALVMFPWGFSEYFVVVVTRERTRWARLAETTANIRIKTQLLRCGLDKEGEWQWSPEKQRWIARKPLCAKLKPEGLTANEPPPFDLTVAHDLYKTLFDPIKDEIKGKHLLVPPTNPPAQVLVTEKPGVAVPSDPAAYARAAWLTKSHALTVLPSVASLKLLRATAGNSSEVKPYIAFANPLLTGPRGTDRRAWDRQACPERLGQRAASSLGHQSKFDSLFRAGLGNVEELRRQEPLPETADEVCAVARDLEALLSEVYLGAKATESAVKRLSKAGELKSHAVLHFATHGLLAGETESIAGGLAEAALVLTPPATPSEEDDGLLTASEVAQLNLNAEWVILSACNTAGPIAPGGAGALSGLVRAFFYAGARALLVSHWYVDSDAAVKLTTRAIAELRREPGIGRAEAVRRAMLAVMVDSSRPSTWMPAAHPTVWAPFVLVAGSVR